MFIFNLKTFTIIPWLFLLPLIETLYILQRPLFAQTVPNVADNLSQRRPEFPPSGIPEPPKPLPPSPVPKPQPPPIELLIPTTPSPSSEQEIPANLATSITVKQFNFAGSTVFTNEELNQVVQEYLNRPLSFAELLQARTAITQFYVEQGYVTSGAYIPPQTIEDGIVTIQIVEGRLEEINVTVEGKLTSSYVRDRLALASGKPLNVNRLLEALQLLQLNPIIGRISAELSSGTSPGTSNLEVAVKVADTFTPEIILDNGRNPAIGSFRRGFQLEDKNLFGYGDTGRLWYLNTDGTNDVDVAYKIPVNARNGEVGLEYRYVSAEVVEEPFEVLDINSDYQKYSISYRQPIYQTPNQEFTLGLTFDRQTSQTRIGDFGGFPSRGTNNEGRTQISTLRFFQEWTQRDQEQVIAARSEFNLGVNWLGTTRTFDEGINPDAPGSDYFIWRGQIQWVRALAPNMLFVMRGDLQVADRPLVPLEQFGIGGLGSVTGYRQNYILTDSGLFWTAEVSLPVYSGGDHLLQIIPFVDVGSGWNAGGTPNPDPSTVASLGLGLQWQYSDYVTARVNWGIPLVSIRKEGTTLQDNGITFSVIVRPF
jgi:hemolysin activation/secretion protein